MIEYTLSGAKKAILLNALNDMIQRTQLERDCFAKGVKLAEMFETKDILQRCEFKYKD